MTWNATRIELNWIELNFVECNSKLFGFKFSTDKKEMEYKLVQRIWKCACEYDVEKYPKP
jgi:hypothetical protein